MASKFNFHMGGHSPSLTSSNQSTPNGPDDATAFNYPPVGSVSSEFSSLIRIHSEILNFPSSLRLTVTWATSLRRWQWIVRRNRPMATEVVAALMAGAPERIQNPRPEFTEILRMNRLLHRRGMKLQAMPMSRIWVDTRLRCPITVSLLNFSKYQLSHRVTLFEILSF